MDKRSSAPRLSRGAAALGIGVCVAVGAYALQGRLDGRGVVQVPGGAEALEISRTYLPQGWAFFTKPADSANTVPYSVRDGHLVAASVGAYAEPRYGFGVDRGPRRQGVEIARLLVGIPKKEWIQCDGEGIVECARRISTSKDVVNSLSQPTLCGEIVLVAEKVTPWAWRDLRMQVRYPVEGLKLRVSCKR